MMTMFITIIARDSKLEGKTENMCVGTKKRGSMTAVVLMDSSHSGTSGGKAQRTFFVLPSTRNSHQRVAECRESTKKFGESCS